MTINTENFRVRNLSEMSQAELDVLYRRSSVGAIPVGEAKGTTIVAPGTPFGSLIAPLIRLPFWQGKVFNPARRNVLNRISPFRFKAIQAKVNLRIAHRARKRLLDFSLSTGDQNR
jgi:hypothetical protein